MSNTEVEILEELRGKDPDALGNNTPDEVRNKTPDELLKLVTVLDAHLRSLHQTDQGEIRDLSVAEDAAFRYGIKVREAAIKRIEEHRAISDVFSRRPAAVKAAYANVKYGLDGDTVNGVVRLTNFEARDMALRRLDDRHSSAHLDSTEKDEIEKQVRRNTDVARRIIVTENEHYRSAFLKMTTRPDGAIYLSEEERDAMKAWDEYRAASLTSASGGYGVPVLVAA